LNCSGNRHVHQLLLFSPQLWLMWQTSAYMLK
jgi:hypothetical protein